MGRERISSLIDGFLSGCLFGVIIGYLILFYSLAEPIPTDTVVAIFVGTVIAVAILVWGVHSALATKET
jgi:ABC-type Mn2+/Zn2+ transport system permease subunit